MIFQNGTIRTAEVGTNRTVNLAYYKKWHGLNRKHWHYKTEISATNRTEISNGIKAAFKLLNVDWEQFICFFESFDRYKHFKFHKPSGSEQHVIELYLRPI